MSAAKSSPVFGPVPSRRLGRSLGVDLVPFKTCTYNCIYCQLGRTTDLTTQPGQWAPPEEIVAAVAARLTSQPDYITLSGSGEPTLYSPIGELIDRIKAITDIPLAVLTNGSLLWRSDVRRGLMNADLVVPSLDAGDEAMFRAINRPCAGISFERMLSGLIDFRREYKGQYWLEVVLLAGHNATDSQVARLAECVRRIGPDRVQLNTATRPPAEDYAYAVSQSRLSELARLFEPPAEVIADFHGVHQQHEFAAGRQTVLEMLRRRPCSLGDIADGLGMHHNEAIKYVEELTAANLIDKTTVAGKLYYRATDESTE